MKFINFLFVMLCLYINTYANETKALREYMNSQSLYWEQLPYQWNEGAFTGNGIMGMMFYADSTDNSLTFWIGRADVTDHRKAPNKKTSMGTNGATVLVDFNRLDIGKIKILPEGKILGGNIELNIFKAEIRGHIQTSNGNMEFIAYTPRDLGVNIIEINSDEKYKVKCTPGLPYSPTFVVFPERKSKMNYVDNPDPIVNNNENDGSCLYNLNAGGDYAVYWKLVKNSDRKSLLYISAENETPKTGLSLKKAMKNVEHVSSIGVKKIKNDMYQWWRDYWGISCINIPDKQLENFYNIQMYKLAVNSTPEGPAIDNLGVLYKTTRWPGIWWNLNIQLTYMSTLTTNRDEQSENFVRLIEEHFNEILQSQVNAKIGDYAWALYVYYSILRYRGEDWSYINETFTPKAMAVIDRYKQNLVMKDGVYHLLQTESPEYEGFKKYDNSNYNLALLNWVITSINEVCANSGKKIKELDELNFIKDNLHSYPVDANGLMIADNKPFAKSHRHYSHLLSFYPLKLQDLQNKDTRELLIKSLKHWMTIENGKALAGYSFTGAASLFALLGDGDNAYNQLKRFLNSSIGISILLPNTMYVESGGKNPVIETPLSAATSVSELLLQNVDNTIMLFPAVPSSWKDCSFKDLRTIGGFIVSAEMKDNELKWVKVSSKSGSICKIKLKGWGEVYCLNNKECVINRFKDDCYILEMKAGEELILSNDPKCKYRWSYPQKLKESFYGVKKGKSLPHIMNW